MKTLSPQRIVQLERLLLPETGRAAWATKAYERRIEVLRLNGFEIMEMKRGLKGDLPAAPWQKSNGLQDFSLLEGRRYTVCTFEEGEVVQQDWNWALREQDSEKMGKDQWMIFANRRCWGGEGQALWHWVVLIR